jgi:hypothetical protein
MRATSPRHATTVPADTNTNPFSNKTSQPTRSRKKTSVNVIGSRSRIASRRYPRIRTGPRAKRLRHCTRDLKFNAMVDRYQQFLSAIGSMRVESAEPDPEVIALGMGWVRGELDADDLAAYAEQSAAGLPLTGRATTGDPERG